MPVLAALLLLFQAPDPGYQARSRAYEALKTKQYEVAIAAFQEAVRLDPSRAAVRKDLAYTLLKVGENEAARDQFEAAMKLDPKDYHVALEFAFLAFETGKQREARLVFDAIRRNAAVPAEQRATAETAFHNIDDPLAQSIARWHDAITREPENFSAHEELAKLAEQRDLPALASEHYERAWRLRPEMRALLLDLGRMWKQTGREADANAALLAASRGPEPRTAEKARELMPRRYPYVSEFEAALALDPGNTELRRELAYLHLEMKNHAAAEKQFELVLAKDPNDRLSAAQLGFLKLNRNDQTAAMPLLNQVLNGPDDELSDRVRAALRLPQTLKTRPEAPRKAVSSEAKQLGEKSFEKGYLNDALKYLTIAHENDPVDFGVMLKLGWTHNMLRQDDQALKWFYLARRSPDPTISKEADRAYSNLRPAFARTRLTIWAFPMYSSRWQTLFGYGQVKLDARIKDWPIRPYLSTRFIGDTRGATHEIPGSQFSFRPQFLSESSIIVALGVATKTWKGVTGWWESGQAIRYAKPDDESRLRPDHRGGLSFAKAVGHPLAPESKGWFVETADDAIYVSRFNNDFLIYSQNRMGWTFAQSRGLHAQLYWNGHITFDSKSEPWANFMEAGPGLRVRFPGLPQQVILSVEALRGAYRYTQNNPQKPVYNDLRIGCWYAFTR
jgi:tetratricopeptide (TPR) repeat protein